MGLLGRVAATLGEHHSELSSKVCDQMAAAGVVTTKHRQSMRHEISQIGAVLGELQAPVLLLKGAAYEALGLPNATGRYSSDVDVMVPVEYLDRAESLLLDQGWSRLEVSAYDQKYYQTWMHEIPPLRHGLRGTYLDLHHAIVPRTSRVKIASAPLFRDAMDTPIDGLATLSAPDLVLHSAVHLFSNGEFDQALRDLLDIRDLVAHFSRDEAFLDQLLNRSIEFNLQRPLYYALSCIDQWFEPVGAYQSQRLLQHIKPNRPTAWLMEQLLRRAVFPVRDPSPLHRLSSLVLFCRAHYLRMPLRLLVPHLSRKLWVRFQRREGESLA